MKYLIIILLFVGCKQHINQARVNKTNTTPPANVSQVNELIKPYAYSFQVLYNKNVDIKISFDANNELKNQGIAGVCRNYQNGDKNILISKFWWDCKQYSLGGNCTLVRPDIEKRVLIFHELGHCLLGREHDYAYNPDGSKVCSSFDSDNNCIAYKYREDSTGKPVSIMYPIMETINNFYYLNIHYYDYELNNIYPQLWDEYSLNLWNTDYNQNISNEQNTANIVEESKCVQYIKD